MPTSIETPTVYQKEITSPKSRVLGMANPNATTERTNLGRRSRVLM